MGDGGSMCVSKGAREQWSEQGSEGGTKRVMEGREGVWERGSNGVSR